MNELYEKLCKLEEKHDYIKNEIYDARVAIQLMKEGRKPVNKGQIARLLTAYKAKMDEAKRETNEAIRMIPVLNNTAKQEEQPLF